VIASLDKEKKVIASEK